MSDELFDERKSQSMRLGNFAKSSENLPKSKRLPVHLIVTSIAIEIDPAGEVVEPKIVGVVNRVPLESKGV